MVLCALLNCCFAVVNKEHFIYDYILDKRQLNTHILHWTFLLEQRAINILLNVVNAVQELVTYGGSSGIEGWIWLDVDACRH